MIEATCRTCGNDFLSQTVWHNDECPECAEREFQAMNDPGYPIYMDTRKERLRERLNVSGDVDE